MSDPPSFGRWLKRLRADLDLTQETLADTAGCAPQTIRSFESGARRPSRELAERLADVLHVPQSQRAEFVRLARMPVTSPPAHPVAQQQDQPQGNAAGTGAGGGTSSARRDGGQGAGNSQAAREQSPILATKLAVPRVRASFIARSRLLARLEAGRAGPLTLVAAPAGFGKTTLLAEWLGMRENRHLHIAWLSLDAGDRDPIQFLRYLVAALQSITPTVGTAVLNLLRSAQAPPVELLAPLLLNELVQLPENSVLVLDDYHFIDVPAVHEALQFLLDHLPPQLHVVIASRVDPPLPLSRMRARGQLTELRVADLRFTVDEAAAFLREVMGLPLLAEEVAALETRTEGWIAGLQLAALAMQNHGDRAGFIQAFAGSNRFVVDYLAEEVIGRLPPHLHSFVLQTSILDRLCGPLCDAVMGVGEIGAAGRSESAYSQAVLMELERANVFLIPLDDERRWYRYHHLFADVVHVQLKHGAAAEQVAELHRRASAWFEQAGLGAEAVQHALAARDWDRLVRLLIPTVPSLASRSQFQTAIAWLDALPDALFHEHPILGVYHASILNYANRVEEAEVRLQVAERALAKAVAGGYPPEKARVMQGQVAVIRAATFRIRGDLARCVDVSRQALELLPETETAPSQLRQMAVVNASRAFLVNGNVSPTSEQVVASAVELVRGSINRWALLMCMTNLARLRALAGRLRQAATTYDEAAQVAPGPGELRAMVGSAAYYFGRGDLLREWNDLVAAEDSLRSGMELVQGSLTVDADVLTLGYISMARLQQARGEQSSATQTLETFEEVARRRNIIDQLIVRGSAARAHLALIQGDFERARHWGDTSGLHSDDDLGFAREPEYLVLARLWIVQGRSNATAPYLNDALRLLDRLLLAAEAGGRVGSMIEILILRALVRHAQSEPHHALADLQRALALAAPEGYVRVFVDEGAPMAALLERLKAEGAPFGQRMNGADTPSLAYVNTLLAAFPARAQGDDEPITPHPAREGHPVHPLPKGRPFSLHPPVEPLTEREREVLRLLAAGYSNQAIADELILAMGTVKRHVNNIMTKLQAQSRLQAVARARELELV